MAYDSRVSTPAGLVPIGELVDHDAVGAKVFDAHGLTKIVATKANGVREVIRLHTKAGHQLDVTPDHVVWQSTGEGAGRWVEAPDAPRRRYYGLTRDGEKALSAGRKEWLRFVAAANTILRP